MNKNQPFQFPAVEAKIYWEKEENSKISYIMVNDKNVVAGSHYGNASSDQSKSAKHHDFLILGALHDTIINEFNSHILKEVIFSVKNIPFVKTFKTKFTASEKRAAYVLRLDNDPKLKTLLDHPETEAGAYLAGKTGLIYDSAGFKLWHENKKYELSGPDNSRVPLPIEGIISAGLSVQNVFYCVVSEHFHAVGQNGEILFTTENDTDRENSLTGVDLRIKDLYRNKDTVILSYYWFENKHPKGFLKYEPGKGFTARYAE